MKVGSTRHHGRIIHEAEVNPEKVLICHCTDCQTLFGSAFRVVVHGPADAFRVLTGEPKKYVKQAESGTRMIQSFCPDCDSPIYGVHVGDHLAFYGVRVAALRQPAPWVDDIKPIPTIERQA